MKLIAAVLFVVLVAVASADTGDFVPKAFYTIDSNGVQSAPSLINPASQSKLLLRLRRQLPPVFSSSSSSSSSSTSSNGGPVFFQSTTSNQHTGPVIPNNIGSLADRFGPDDGATGTTQFQANNGVGTFTHTQGFFYPNGQVGNYQTQTGKF